MKLIGPFGKAQRNAAKFCQGMHRSYIFLELLNEIEAVEKVLNTGTEEEKLLAQIVFDQLQEQLSTMIYTGDQDGNSRKRSSV